MDFLLAWMHTPQSSLSIHRLVQHEYTRIADLSFRSGPYALYSQSRVQSMVWDLSFVVNHVFSLRGIGANLRKVSDARL